jgi:hypothetical protein
MQIPEKVPPKNRLPAQRLTIESARAARRRRQRVFASGPNEGPWIAEAHSDHTVEAFVIVCTGTSRSAGLLAVAAAWREKAPMVGLRAFDWEAIAEALRGANACD